MSTLRRIGTAALLLTFIAGFSFADTDFDSHSVTINVVEVASIGLSSTATVTLNTVAPGSPGDDPTGESDASKTLQYTSLNATGANRTVEAGLSAATPAGTNLSLAVTDPGDAGGLGLGTGSTALSTVATSVLTDIGSIATGATGPVLTYQLGVTSVAALIVGAGATVTVTLTLSEDT